MFTFLFFIIIKSSLTNPSPNVKNKVTNKVICLTGKPITDINSAVVIILLVTE